MSLLSALARSLPVPTVVPVPGMPVVPAEDGACGVGAGALWGLVFLAPELASDFSPLMLTIGRYLCYGLIAAALAAPCGHGSFTQSRRRRR